MRPRKYFWATMFVAFCDQVFGNSTSACSNLPTDAVRSSHSTVSNGSCPAVVNLRSILSPVAPALAVTLRVFSLALRVSGMRAPCSIGRLLSAPTLTSGGKIDTGVGVGWNGVAVERELARPGERLGADALELRLELAEVVEVAVDGREHHARDGVELDEPAQRQLADQLGVRLWAEPADARGDRVGQRLELSVGHGPLVGRPVEAAQELLAVEALALAVALADRHRLGLRALVGGEALAAALALAAAPDRVAGLGEPGVHDARGRGVAIGAMHGFNSTRCSGGDRRETPDIAQFATSGASPSASVRERPRPCSGRPCKEGEIQLSGRCGATRRTRRRGPTCGRWPRRPRRAA